MVNTVVERPIIDDDGAILLCFENSATGILSTSQVAAGEENALKIMICGKKDGSVWSKLVPNTLIIKWFAKPAER